MIKKYTVDAYEPGANDFSVDGDKAKWYKENGVPATQGSEMKGIDVYGAKVDLDDVPRDFAPAWSGAVDPVNGVQIRNGEFRTGGAGEMKADRSSGCVPQLQADIGKCLQDWHHV
jgi:hypothetical protein